METMRIKPIKINWKQAGMASMISAVIVIFLFITKCVQIPYQSGNQISYYHLGPDLNQPGVLMQQFVPQYRNMEYISVYVGAACEDTEEGAIRVSLLDENFEVVTEKELYLKDIIETDYYTVVEHVDLNVGHYYYLALEGVDIQTGSCAPLLYYSKAAAGIEQTDCILTYNEQPIESGMLKMNIKYNIPLSVKYYVVYFAFLAFVFSVGMEFIGQKKNVGDFIE